MGTVLSYKLSSGVPNFVVELINSTNIVIDTHIHTTGGTYQFNNVLDDTYSLKVTDGIGQEDIIENIVVLCNTTTTTTTPPTIVFALNEHATNEGKGLYQSLNGGGFTQLSTPSGSTIDVYTEVDFSNNVGYLVGNPAFQGSIARTTNYGSSWTLINKTTAMSGDTTSNVSTPFVINATTHLFSVSSQNYILKSTNGGSSFIRKTLPSSLFTTRLYFNDANNGYLLGTDTSSFNLIIYKTTNGGESWSSVFNAFFPTNTLSDIHFESTGIIGFATLGNATVMAPLGSLYRSINGGTVWTNITSTLPGFIDAINSVWMLSKSTVLIVTDNNTTSDNRIYRSTDTGNTWTLVDSSPTPNELGKLLFYNSTLGYIPFKPNGSANYTYKITTDGGITWTTQSAPPNVSFTKIVGGRLHY